MRQEPSLSTVLATLLVAAIVCPFVWLRRRKQDLQAELWRSIIRR